MCILLIPNRPILSWHLNYHYIFNFQSSPQKNAANAGGSAPKRARIEPPVFDDDETEPKKEEAAAKAGDIKPVAAAGPAKKKWVHKKKTGGNNQPQPVKVEPTPAKPLELQTKKNLGVKARVGGAAKPAAPLQRPAPGRYPAGGLNSRAFQGNRGGGQTQLPRMAQVPSPWAMPQAQTPNWFGGNF